MIHQAGVRYLLKEVTSRLCRRTYSNLFCHLDIHIQLLSKEIALPFVYLLPMQAEKLYYTIKISILWLLLFNYKMFKDRNKLLLVLHPPQSSFRIIFHR